MTVTPPSNRMNVDMVTEWRADFENMEINTLHAECFRHQVRDYDWRTKLSKFSLGWACTRYSRELIGFVNVAWDGGLHAFLLDTMVSPAFQRQGVAKGLIELAVERSKQAGCEWLHVDFDARLRPFYLYACGFRPTDAGILSLN